MEKARIRILAWTIPKILTMAKTKNTLNILLHGLTWFLLSETKCQIFRDIVSERDIFIFSCTSVSERHIFTNDPSMIFNDHSILLHMDYYWLILDYNHDSRLNFCRLQLFRIKIFFFELMIIEYHWSLKIIDGSFVKICRSESEVYHVQRLDV